MRGNRNRQTARPKLVGGMPRSGRLVRGGAIISEGATSRRPLANKLKPGRNKGRIR